MNWYQSGLADGLAQVGLLFLISHICLKCIPHHYLCNCSYNFAIELVEGKDAPQKPPDSTNKYGKTAGLLIPLTKSFYMTDKVVILESGLCVLKCLIEFKKRTCMLLLSSRSVGIGQSTFLVMKLIKNKEKKVGECDSLRETINNISYNIFCMKDPNYMMKIMSIYSGLVEKKSIKTLMI